MRLDMSKRAKPAGRPEARTDLARARVRLTVGPNLGPLTSRGQRSPREAFKNQNNCEGAVNFDKEQ